MSRPSVFAPNSRMECSPEAGFIPRIFQWLTHINMGMSLALIILLW